MTRFALTMAMLLGGVSDTSAQAVPVLPVEVSLQGSLGAAAPIGDFGDSSDGLGVEAGPALAATATIHLSRIVGVYGAYQWTRFGCDGCGAFGLEEEVVAEGAEVGLQLNPSLPMTAFSPWLRGGLVRQTLSFSGFGDRIGSEAAFGFALAAGAKRTLGSRLEIVPSLRYFTFPAGFEFQGLPDRSLDVAAIAAELGLSIHF